MVAELEAAARRSVAVGGHEAASAAWERAAELTLDPGDRGRRLYEAAMEAWTAGRPERAAGLVDGALLAHLGVPDMRVPIAYALHYPHRLPAGASDLQLPYVGSLSFEEPDERLFPSIALAREAGRRGDGVTCAMNAANEVAVHAFLRGTISFPDITAVAAGAILDWEPEEPRSFEAAEAVDAEARGRAAALCARAAATFSEGSAC